MKSWNAYYFGLLFLLPFTVSGQSPLTISSENTKKGVALYASSLAYCPLSLALSLDLENAYFDYNKAPFFVVPARAQHFKLGDINIYDKTQAWHYTYQIKKICWGDLRITTYDSLYEYTLPWPKDLTFRVIQGYGGVFSHQDVYALDFGMPEGTAVLAARDGIVIVVVQQYSTSCLDDSYKQRNNMVMVYHIDGTIDTYAHIRYNGAVVKVGDTVKTGDTLAYSGNTGYSAGPHLHFSCSLPGVARPITIPTKFSSHGQVGYLIEKQLYKKD